MTKRLQVICNFCRAIENIWYGVRSVPHAIDDVLRRDAVGVILAQRDRGRRIFAAEDEVHVGRIRQHRVRGIDTVIQEQRRVSAAVTCHGA